MGRNIATANHQARTVTAGQRERVGSGSSVHHDSRCTRTDRDGWRRTDRGGQARCTQNQCDRVGIVGAGDVDDLVRVGQDNPCGEASQVEGGRESGLGQSCFVGIGPVQIHIVRSRDVQRRAIDIQMNGLDAVQVHVAQRSTVDDRVGPGQHDERPGAAAVQNHLVGTGSRSADDVDRGHSVRVIDRDRVAVVTGVDR